VTDLPASEFVEIRDGKTCIPARVSASTFRKRSLKRFLPSARWQRYMGASPSILEHPQFVEIYLRNWMRCGTSSERSIQFRMRYCSACAAQEKNCQGVPHQFKTRKSEFSGCCSGT
jgi:hypothetical protein